MQNNTKLVFSLCLVSSIFVFLLITPNILGDNQENNDALVFTFNDPFDDLIFWTFYGSPAPVHIGSIFAKDGVFDNNGDGTDKSGAISEDNFTMDGGFTIESEIYLDFSDSTGCWAEAAIGIANPTIQGWGGYDPYIYFSIAALGDACTDYDVSLRRHAYFLGSYITGSGQESFFPTTGNPTEFLADTYGNGWHTLKIDIDVSGMPNFYIDNNLVYSGAQAVSATLTTGSLPLWLGSHSSGDVGKAYHNDITFINSCEPPGNVNQSSPANGATVCNTLVTFDWSDVGGATAYQIQIDDNNDFSSPETDLQLGSASSAVSLVMADDCQFNYWRVRAINDCSWSAWSGTRSVSVCTSPAVATLFLPADEAVDVAQPIALYWHLVDGATNYQVQIDIDSTFPAPVKDAALTDTTCSIAELDGSTLYYWRVRAFNVCNTADWSDIWDFTTEVCNLPAIATLIAPLDSVVDLTQPITLDWNDAAFADSYRVVIDTDTNFTTPELDQMIDISTLDVSDFDAGSSHFWKVRGHNGCGWGDWSETWYWTICSAVDIPTTVEPVDGDTIINGPAFFDWNDVDSAGKYLLQVDDDSLFGSPNLHVELLATSPSHFGTYSLADGTLFYWRVRAYNDCGWGDWSTIISFHTDVSQHVEEIESSTLPQTFKLSQNYPNPFNPETLIEFALPHSSQVRLEIFNIAGKKVKILVNEYLSAGIKRVSWNGHNRNGEMTASGIYLYRLTAGNFVKTKKMVLMK